MGGKKGQKTAQNQTQEDTIIDLRNQNKQLQAKLDEQAQQLAKLTEQIAKLTDKLRSNGVEGGARPAPAQPPQGETEAQKRSTKKDEEKAAREAQSKADREKAAQAKADKEKELERKALERGLQEVVALHGFLEPDLRRLLVPLSPLLVIVLWAPLVGSFRGLSYGGAEQNIFTQNILTYTENAFSSASASTSRP